ncbi:MAG: carboxymuconolactone decarboxylase family protein [Saccharofermentanales bacterium]
MPGRLMTWYPRAAIGSGVLEVMAAKGKTRQEKRLLKLIRLQASLVCSCSFCIDMNAAGMDTNGITTAEIMAMKCGSELEDVKSFSKREITALEYAILMSKTPLVFEDEFVKKLKSEFSEKEIVMMASTIASVNFWARFNQALGVLPAGFNEECLISKFYKQGG